MTIRVGVTGTRFGLSWQQLATATQELRLLIDTGSIEPIELHHGDCIGADVQLAAIASGLGYDTVAHPPIKDKYRAHHPSDKIMPPAGYLARDRSIVDNVGVLIACPLTPTNPERNSGTWYTIRYAREQDVPVILIQRDGEVVP